MFSLFRKTNSLLFSKIKPLFFKSELKSTPPNQIVSKHLKRAVQITEVKITPPKPMISRHLKRNFQLAGIKNTHPNPTISKYLKRNVQIRDEAIKQINQEKLNDPKRIEEKLPQTKDIEEIFVYFRKYKKILRKEHLLIIASRLAHIKEIGKVKKHENFEDFVKKISYLNSLNEPKYISNFVKYCSIIGIENKLLWRNLISSIFRTDFTKNLTEFAKLLNYLQKYGKLNKKLFSDLQTIIIELFDNNKDNQSFVVMELLLNGLKNFKIEDELRERLIKRLQVSINIMPVKNLRNSLIASAKLKLSDSYIWELFTFWSFHRLEKELDNLELLQANYSFFVYTYGKMLADDFLNTKSEFVKKIDNKNLSLFELLLQIFDKYQSRLYMKNNAANFLRILEGFSVYHNIIQKPTNELVLNYLIHALMTNEELQGYFSVANYFEIFKIFASLYDQYNPYERFEGLLSFMENKFISNIFDSDLTTLLNVLNFFTKNYESFVEFEGAENMERVKKLLVMNLEIAETIAKEDEKCLIENIKIVLKSYAWI